ncbi:MAG: HAMP domain-containing sensor histidine kinase [Nibricoccus sp.]
MRRLFIYWLLLLLAAAGVGGGAWFMLKRESARLEVRKSSTEAARRAAVEARAQLIAENVELLVGDVEAGLLDTLAEVSSEQLDSFLSGWEHSNPLIRASFRCALDGKLLRPPSTATTEDARGFRRRFAKRLSEEPPWGRAASEAAPVMAQRQMSEEERKDSADRPQQQLSLNVAKVQSARKETQALARAKTSNSAMADFKQELRETDRLDGDKRLAGAPAAAPAKSVAAPERRGWAPIVSEGRLHLLGWLQPAGENEIRGVEVEMAALVSRLAAAMPSEMALDESYVLRDDKSRIIHQAGKVSSSIVTPETHVPIGSALLPGWEVAGYLAYSTSDDTSGFLTVGLLLTCLLVVAILVGGSLLLFQARSSAADAAQKTSFVSNVSHEFKTPLTTIRLYSELLEQGRVADESKRNEYLRTIGRETQRLARLVNNVLDFSRLEQGRKKFQCEPLDVAQVLRQLIAAHAPRVAEAGIVLKQDLPIGEVSATLDRDAVEQIVLNLLDNACKYAAEGGEVLVSLRNRSERGAEIRVSDRGPGVPPSHRERIFEKFHRVDDALTAEKSGAGLGLSIARQLARGMNGELTYEPRIGGGAEFVLTLP